MPLVVTPVENQSPAERVAFVLLVDDDLLVRRHFERLLGRLVGRVETADDGLDALERIRGLPPGERPDLVITDLSMPRLNGAQLAAELHALDPGIAVCVVTAFDPPEVYELLESGVAVAVLPKPTPLSELRAVLAQSQGSRAKDRPTSSFP